MEKVQQSNEACQRGDFEAAVHLYSEALQADPQNCILYSNRSAALLKMGQHQVALEDAEKACELNPKWPKVSVGLRLKLCIHKTIDNMLQQWNLVLIVSCCIYETEMIEFS